SEQQIELEGTEPETGSQLFYWPEYALCQCLGLFCQCLVESLEHPLNQAFGRHPELGQPLVGPAVRDLSEHSPDLLATNRVVAVASPVDEQPLWMSPHVSLDLPLHPLEQDIEHGRCVFDSAHGRQCCAETSHRRS